MLVSVFSAACEDGDLRLENGTTSREGRLEICYGNIYGTICDDQWGLLDARVACRDLGFPGAGNVATNCYTCAMIGFLEDRGTFKDKEMEFFAMKLVLLCIVVVP